MPQFLRPGCCSSKSRSRTLDNEESVEKENNLLSWKMPKVPKSKIYRRKRFTHSYGRPIKTIEGKVSFGHGSGAVRLINEKPTMNACREKRSLSILNVGMIQIGVKTLIKKVPSNASIILCVRDTRLLRFEDSLLGMVESKLADGPFYFNIFPNLNMSVTDPHLLSALVLNVIVDGFDHLPAGSKPITVICRTRYQLQHGFDPYALLLSPIGRTVFFQTHIGESNATVQKNSKWDEVQNKLEFPSAVEKAEVMAMEVKK